MYPPLMVMMGAVTFSCGKISASAHLGRPVHRVKVPPRAMKRLMASMLFCGISVSSVRVPSMSETSSIPLKICPLSIGQILLWSQGF